MASKRILMLAGDFVEDYEIMVPYQALKMVGHSVDVVCPDKSSGDVIKTSIHDFEGDQTYTEKVGHNFILNATFSEVDESSYDALMIPGGRAPEYIRMNERVLAIVRYFAESGKPIAAICHGLQVMTAAGVLKGRSCTAYPAVGPDINQCGGTYVAVDIAAAHVSDNWVTAPAWPAQSEWLSKFLAVLGTRIEL